MKTKYRNLGILFSLGDSFSSLKKNGQDIRFINEYLKRYSHVFNKIYIFSYAKEKVFYSKKKKILPRKCFILENKYSYNRFLYQFLIPFLYFNEIKKIDVFRVMQLTGVLPAILLRIIFQKPFIFTYGYNYFAFAKLEKQKIRPILLKILEKIVMRLALGVIVTSKRIESYLGKKYPKTKLFYIPNGVNIKQFTVKKEKSKFVTNKSKIKILTVARLERQKNLDNLIKATALLGGKYKMELLFIGQGKLKFQLVKLAKKLKVKLKVVDRVAYNNINIYYQKADIFCLPSLQEGHPKTLLEAMASGLPCLVGKYSGVEEFKDKEEILRTGFKAKEIARNLDFLVKNSDLRKRLTRNARKRIIKDFNIEKLLDKEVKILNN